MGPDVVLERLGEDASREQLPEVLSSASSRTSDPVRDDNQRAGNQVDLPQSAPDVIQTQSGSRDSLRSDSSADTPDSAGDESLPNQGTLGDARFGRINLLSPWFPEVDPRHIRAQGWRTRHSKRQSLLLIAFATSHTILLANFSCLIAFHSLYGSKSHRGLIPMFEGDCNQVELYGIFAHIAINIISTLLLGASNLCMQLLVAPTRDEVDKAHNKRIWLDIGVPSWRNIQHVAWGRRVLWLLLGVSSIPLHFTYNSAISTSVAQLGYATVIANEAFLHGADIGNWTEITMVGDNPFNQWPPMEYWNNWQAFQNIQANASNDQLFEKLSNKECINKYHNVFSKRTSLVVVLEDRPNDSRNASVHQYKYWPAQYGGWSSWAPCAQEWGNIPYQLPEYKELGYVQNSPPCQDLIEASDTQFQQWSQFNRTVLYCLSERALGEHCRINYSPVIFIMICCLSLVKSVCILMTLISHKKSALCTIGDAIASFLEVPDPVTAQMGPVTKDMFKSNKSRVWSEDSTLLWLPRPQRWSVGASVRRWRITLGLCAIAIAAALASAIAGQNGTHERIRHKTFAWQMKQGPGRIDADAWTAYFISHWGQSGLLLNVAWANMWQVVISFLYLAYNSLLTCMLVSDEWGRYATERKPLRVTHPRGIQRSTYFLSLPYKYAIPLMMANTTLHWLISQSIFIVSVTTFYPNYVETVDDVERGTITASYTVTAYNTQMTIISIVFGTVLVLAIAFVSWVNELPSGIPFVSTCSAAISAACHCPTEDTDASLLPVKWGVNSPANETPIRCSFTTLRDVRSPTFGEEITGAKQKIA